MARKTAKDYRDDLMRLNLRTRALTANVRERLVSLIQQYPTSPVTIDHHLIQRRILALPPEACITYIAHFEEWLKGTHPHRQTRIDFPGED